MRKIFNMTAAASLRTARLVAVFFISVLLTSCITQQKCMEKFPPYIHDSIVYKDKDTTLPVSLNVKGEILGFDFEVQDTSLTVKKEVKKEHLTARVSISKGKGKVECLEDSLRRVNDSLKVRLRLVESYGKMVIQKPPVIKYKEHWELIPLRYWFLITFSAIVGIGLYKYFT